MKDLNGVQKKTDIGDKIPKSAAARFLPDDKLEQVRRKIVGMSSTKKKGRKIIPWPRVISIMCEIPMKCAGICISVNGFTQICTYNSLALSTRERSRDFFFLFMIKFFKIRSGIYQCF